jgi:creatinine amidohydrolase
MTGPDVLRWETLTKRQFDTIERREAVVLVTCSPLEVHGPHLPLGADALEGEGLSERTLRHLPERHRGRTFLKLPFVYAATDTVPQAGSLTFRPSTTIRVLEDLGRSLAAQGFRNVFVSNFHGSPRHFLAIETACHRVARACDIRMVPIFSLMLTRLDNGGGSELGDVLGHVPGVEREQLDGDTHGGLVETSQLLALHPDWVDPDYKGLPRRTVKLWRSERGEAPAPGRGRIARIRAALNDFRAGIRFFSEETYSGAPAEASPELGEQILDLLAGRTAEAITEILDGSLPRDQWHSPFWKLRHVFVHPWSVRIADALLQVPKTTR